METERRSTTPDENAGILAVDVRGLEVRYPGADTKAVDGVDFQVRPGEIVALLGPNGAGKSTLIGTLLDLIEPTAGSVRVFGSTPRGALEAGRVGAMLQTAGLAEQVSVKELISFVASLHRDPMPLEQVLAAASLEDIAGRRVEKLSGGQRQRVRFGLTLVGRPQLLILDEPTNEMDVASRQSFWAQVRAAAADGRSVLFSTHHMTEVEQAADRVVVIAGGRTIADETPQELRRRSGGSTVRFRSARPVPTAELLALPGVTGCSEEADALKLTTVDPDATVRALVAQVPDASDLQVQAVDLEEAYLSVVASAGL
ncbi:ABC transporter ATP-binding protein [Streptomyces sp. NBC_00503]|uniref:ABC transporter ATP-binding protein n=1 Tax=Streptomyces sp. NBC_00503 TaxID=2903659 RepID=UPI002E81E2A4|nr:ABC transporter ATP-binding protein [Streptomyces sp. NBC_00503]WUD82554.1 ABC transporter ATP-binding protein [Streptomyces sp. NBC_00503]